MQVNKKQENFRCIHIANAQVGQMLFEDVYANEMLLFKKDIMLTTSMIEKMQSHHVQFVTIAVRNYHELSNAEELAKEKGYKDKNKMTIPNGLSSLSMET